MYRRHSVLGAAAGRKCRAQLNPPAYRRRQSIYCTYIAEHQESISVDGREQFWRSQAEQLSWFDEPTAILDDEGRGVRPRWFPGGSINACYNAVDRHVSAGFGHQTAILHDSPVTDSAVSRRLTFAQLKKQVSQLAGVLAKRGVCAGDRVLIYMPMIPEAVIAMLACARLGAVHSLVFGGDVAAAPQLANRISHAQPKLILSASYGVERTRTVNYKQLLDEALSSSSNHSVTNCLIFQRPGCLGPPVKMKPGMDLDWAEETAGARGHDCVPVTSTSPMYILYTSGGTTGQPKGVVRPLGGHLVMLKYTMDAVFDVRPGETVFSTSDLGRVEGHSYGCYAPLLNRNTTVLFEGEPVGTPDVSAYYRVISQHSPACVFTKPTALRAIRSADPFGHVAKKYPMKNLRSIFVSGEHLDTETNIWARKTFKKPIVDHYWQTESGSPILAVLGGRGVSLDVPLGTSGKPVPGFDVRVVDKGGRQVECDTLGNIIIKCPMPPGFTDGLCGDSDDAIYTETYFTRFPGFYDTHDTGTIDLDGNISVMSRRRRTDDVINVAGHPPPPPPPPLSTSAIEESILRHPEVAECAVIPVPHPINGATPLAVLVCRAGAQSEQVVRQEVIEHVRKDIGPVAAFNKVVCVSKLPKTRSGKISRGTMTALAQNKSFNIPSTIEDVTAYDELAEKLPSLGFATHPEIDNRDNFK